MEGRDNDQRVAATRMITGTDVDYGALTHLLVSPVGVLAVILAVLHPLIAMVRRHRLVSRAQEGDILLAPDEAQMRAPLQERARIGNGALGDEV